MPRVTRDGVSIHYDRERGDGRGEGVPVVFLQGLGLGRWQWRWQREALASAGEYDLIAPDTRGTDRSDAGLPPLVGRLPRRLRSPLLQSRLSYSVGGLAADLEAVLEDAGVRDAHLVGLDLGGMVAQRYALEYSRAASLTLIGTSHGGVDAMAMDEDVLSELLASADSPRETARERLRPLFAERFTNRNPHLLDRLIEWQLAQAPSNPALESQLGAMTGFDVSDRLKGLRLPTLVIHGSGDRIVPVENGRLFEAKLPNVQFLELEGGSHGCFLEQADRVNDVLESFLAEVSATTTATV
ncbi:alpha/beta fold hydrolase [Natronosalvus rutilus]|uniref:Alpha/beta hydrolase n=1 Tax=Natronosalvus rutilus TaxID=2953753 RepID=A0A9E7NBI8_9EURY|nr:alpha/beta hydrolase [Natronosalvus rutilus]UTF53900.1 alpha/beta hydrolase [Natronosalvus rutilus]